MRALRDSLDAPEQVAVFGSGMVPEHGIFQAGWALAAAVELARASGDSADREDVRRRAGVIEEALRGSRSGFLESYPDQYWPCDTVVAASALTDAAVLLDQPEWLVTVRTWRAKTMVRSADPATGLLPHRVDSDGRSLEGPRGSSQSVIQAFWPAIGHALDGRTDIGSWLAFRRWFVVREAGLVGVREYPLGADGSGDVDSGPPVLGVSASASTVSLAAARAVGDAVLTEDLGREAELLGLPMSWRGERRYVFGALPVGDAFPGLGADPPGCRCSWTPAPSPAGRGGLRSGSRSCSRWRCWSQSAGGGAVPDLPHWPRARRCGAGQHRIHRHPGS